MSSTTTYKLIRMGVIVALIAGGAVACQYKAGSQYANGDSTNTDAAMASGAAAGTIPGAIASPVTKSADSAAAGAANATAMSASATSSSTSAASTTPVATSNPTTKAKFSRGRASVTAPRIYTAAEVAPQFPGGQRALDKYITKNVNYPQQAIDDDVSGTVHVSFIVDEQGRVTKAKVLDAANLSDGLDQEALRVVRNMPSWMPGKVRGKKVKTRLELPISFLVES
jgi:protein TonB